MDVLYYSSIRPTSTTYGFYYTTHFGIFWYHFPLFFDKKKLRVMELLAYGSSAVGFEC